MERRLYSETTAREIDCAVKALVEEAYDRATAILTACRGQLVRGAGDLLRKETLTADELPAIEVDSLPSAAAR